MGVLTERGDDSIDTRNSEIRGDVRRFGEAVGVEFTRSLFKSTAMARAVRDPEDFVSNLTEPDANGNSSWGAVYQAPEVPLTKRESFSNSYVGLALSKAAAPFRRALGR